MRDIYVSYCPWADASHFFTVDAGLVVEPHADDASDGCLPRDVAVAYLDGDD